MRIAYEYLDEPIYFGSDFAHVLVIENKTLFRRTLRELRNGNEDKMFVFSKDYSPFSFSDVAYIPDPTDPDFSDRKLLTRINAHLTKGANENCMDDMAKIVRELIDFGNKLCGYADFDVGFCEDIDAPMLVKFLAFRPRTEGLHDELERLVAYFRLFTQHLGIKVFVVTNFFLYFSADEAQKLIHELHLTCCYVLFVENRQPDCMECQATVIDDSLCVIKK